MTVADLFSHASVMDPLPPPRSAMVYLRFSTSDGEAEVELAGGGLYQLACTDAGWCVEGMLD